MNSRMAIFLLRKPMHLRRPLDEGGCFPGSQSASCALRAQATRRLIGSPCCAIPTKTALLTYRSPSSRISVRPLAWHWWGALFMSRIPTPCWHFGMSRAKPKSQRQASSLQACPLMPPTVTGPKICSPTPMERPCSSPLALTAILVNWVQWQSKTVPAFGDLILLLATSFFLQRACATQSVWTGTHPPIPYGPS